MNFIMLDVKLVGYFFKYASFGVTTPVTLCMSLLLALLFGQPYSMICSLVMIVVGYVLLLIAKNIGERRKHKLDLFNQRIITATELITQIKQIREQGY